MSIISALVSSLVTAQVTAIIATTVEPQLLLLELNISGLENEITNLENLLDEEETVRTNEDNSLDTRIQNLISSPIPPGEDSLYGRRIFAEDFYFLATISEVDGLTDKLNLFDSKIGNKISSISSSTPGLTINSTDPQNPVITYSEPAHTEFYLKTETYNRDEIDAMTSYATIIEGVDTVSTGLTSGETQVASTDLLKSELNKKVNTTDIKNNLTSTDTDKPLSALQGKTLKDLLDSINTSSIPVGSIVATFKDTPDTNYIFLNRQILNKTTYSALWSVVQTFPDSFFDNTGADTSKFKNHDATTFYLPDFRAISLVNSGTNSGYTKANGNNYSETLGNTTKDKMFNHGHSASYQLSVGQAGSLGNSAAGSNGSQYYYIYNPINNGDGVPYLGDKNNPFQVTINYQMRYL